MRQFGGFAASLILCFGAVVPAVAQGHRPGGSTPARSGPIEFQERVIAGGEPGDFMVVRHVLLRGANFDIGRKLAELAATRHGFTLKPASDPRMARVRRTYLTRYFPGQVERARGVASYFKKSPADDQYWFGGLPFGAAEPGCSVVYYPPGMTADGGGVLSRNFDFTTGALAGKDAGVEEVAACRAPYVLELYPHQGHASISICAFDLLGGVVDGINSEGLCVALLADEDAALSGRRPPPVAQAGFGVVEIGRYLLETCANVEQAKDALLEARLYATTTPCHYIVADRHGRSFIWENDVGGAYGHIIDGHGRIQTATNFLQHLHPEALNPERPAAVCERFTRVRERIAQHAGKLDAQAIREISRGVAAEGPAAGAASGPVRTLWHALYSPEQRAMEVSFYLGEGTAGEAAGVRRSDYIRIGFAP